MKLLALVWILAIGCGGPSRTSYAQYPGAPLAYDRASATPEALDIADKVLAAHGGAAAWAAAKQVRWRQTVMVDGKPTLTGEQAWDRWNARHWAKTDREKGGAFAVFFDLYGTHVAGYIVGRSGGRQTVSTGEAAEGAVVARKAWQRDATVTLVPFLLHEPGAKLEYLGLAKDGDLELHELKVTFDPKDTARTGLEVHAFADKDTFLIRRISLVTAAGDRFGYELGAYQASGGLQLATERKNLGSGEVVQISEIKVSEPDEDLFIAPVS